MLGLLGSNNVEALTVYSVMCFYKLEFTRIILKGDSKVVVEAI